MKRIITVLTVAMLMAAMLALTASMVLAQPQPEHNCNGALQSGAVAGQGGNPGTGNGQVTSGVAKDQGVDDFQQNFGPGASANCGDAPGEPFPE
jgi:hypothetical protein